MAASSLMSIGTRAMFANFAALTTTGGTTLPTPPHAGLLARQEAQLATAKGQYTGAGFMGKGVDVTTVTRSYDRFLTSQAAATSSLAAADSAHLDQLTQLESVFPLGESGIGQAARQVLDGFVDVANNPQDPSARQGGAHAPRSWPRASRPPATSFSTLQGRRVGRQ